MSELRDEAMSPSVSLHSVGAILRQTRTRLGLSVADVADKTKFSPQQIEALETDCFEGGTAYLRGFVRNYARVLNLDAQRLLDMLPQPQPQQTESIPEPIGQRFNEGHAVHLPSKTWGVATGALAMLVAAVALWNYTAPKVNIDTPVVAQSAITTAPPVENAVVTTAIPVENAVSAVVPAPVLAQASATMPTAQPVIAPYVAENTSQTTQPVAQVVNATLDARPAAAGIAKLPTNMSPTVSTLRFEFDDDAWVQVKDKDGKMLSSKLNRKGSSLTVEGMRPFNLVVGHAVAVRMYDQEKPVDLKPYIDINVARLTLQ